MSQLVTVTDSPRGGRESGILGAADGGPMADA